MDSEYVFVTWSWPESPVLDSFCWFIQQLRTDWRGFTVCCQLPKLKQEAKKLAENMRARFIGEFLGNIGSILEKPWANSVFFVSVEDFQRLVSKMSLPGDTFLIHHKCSGNPVPHTYEDYKTTCNGTHLSPFKRTILFPPRPKSPIVFKPKQSTDSTQISPHDGQVVTSAGTGIPLKHAKQTSNSLNVPQDDPPPVISATTPYLEEIYELMRKMVSANQSPKAVQTLRKDADSLANALGEQITRRFEQLHLRLRTLKDTVSAHQVSTSFTSVAKIADVCTDAQRTLSELTEDLSQLQMNPAFDEVYSNLQTFRTQIDNLRERVENEYFPLRVTLGLSKSVFFLIFQNLDPEHFLNVKIVSSPETFCVPSWVLLTRELEYIPINLNPSVQIDSKLTFWNWDFDHPKKYCRHSLRISNTLLGELVDLDLDFDLDNVWQEQELKQIAYNRSLSGIPGTEFHPDFDFKAFIRNNPGRSSEELLELL